MTHTKHSAFTLIEIMIVIALIGGLMAILGPRIMTMFGKAKTRTVSTMIGQLKSNIAEFEMDLGRKPKGLKELTESNDPKWRGPYYKGESEDGIPTDAWKHPFIYHAPPQLLKKEGYRIFEIISYGETGDDTIDQREWIHGGE